MLLLAASSWCSAGRRYFAESDMKDNVLFCSVSKSTTKPVEVMQTLAVFFDQEELKWENFGGVSTDGAPAMLRARSGLKNVGSKSFT